VVFSLRNKLGRVKLVVSDVDGTLTVSRSSFVLSCEAIEAISMLEQHGIAVGLASGNSLPVLAGLGRYLGTSGPVIAENGCVVMIRRGDVVPLCSKSAREAAEVVSKELGLEPSWQNRFRMYDYALMVADYPREKIRELTAKANEILRKRGYDDFYAFTSGFAIHIHPAEADKGTALKYVASRLGLPLEMVAAIGDSSLDIALLKAAGVRVAVGDADDELKHVADLVMKGFAGKGFAEFAYMLISARKNV